MDINNELANQKPSHIKDNLITALEKIINLLQDSKKFIELYLVPQFCNAKNNKRKIAKNYMGFDFQTSKLLSFSIPKSEKIFCRIKNNKISTSISIGLNQLLNYEYNINQKYNITKKTIDYSTAYFINSLREYICINLDYFLEHKLSIKKCSNCNKYFIPYKRKSEKYCDYIFKDRKNL